MQNAPTPVRGIEEKHHPYKPANISQFGTKIEEVTIIIRNEIFFVIFTFIIALKYIDVIIIFFLHPIKVISHWYDKFKFFYSIKAISHWYDMINLNFFTQLKPSPTNVVNYVNKDLYFIQFIVNKL